jgi:hypothetical protein
VVPSAEPGAVGGGAHRAGHLDPGNERQRWLHLVQAAAHQHVGKADPGGGNVDEHLAKFTAMSWSYR